MMVRPPDLAALFFLLVDPAIGLHPRVSTLTPTDHHVRD
jgi:hypothetical protein